MGTRDASHEDANLAHYPGSLQVRYLRILIVRMESRAAVEHLSSVLFPKSTRRDWHHQKQPVWRQHRLNGLPLSQGHGSFHPSCSSSSLSPCTMRTPRLTLVSDGRTRTVDRLGASVFRRQGRCLRRWATGLFASIKAEDQGLEPRNVISVSCFQDSVLIRPDVFQCMRVIERN